MQDFILRSAARLNLPIKWVPDRIAEQNFNLEEPPTTASAWVGVMLKHLQTFRQRLSTMPTLTTRDVDQVRPDGGPGFTELLGAACMLNWADHG